MTCLLCFTSHHSLSLLQFTVILLQGSTYLFETLLWKVILLATLFWVNKDEHMQPNRFSQSIGQYIFHSSENNFIVSN